MMHLEFNKRPGRKKSARRRLLHFEQCEQRLLLTSVVVAQDAAGDFATLFGELSDDPAMRVRIETSDTAGVPISEARVGEEFLVSLYVQDVRETAAGVFAAYVDLLYDPDLVVAGDVVKFGDDFIHDRTIGINTPGVIDEVGGFSGSFTGSGSSELLLMSMPFIATHPGHVDLVVEPPDYVGSIPLVFGHDEGVPFNEIDFGRTTIDVVARGLSELEPISTNVTPTSNNSASLFKPISSFRSAGERFGSVEKLSEDFDPARFFATTHATNSLAANGGFNSLDELGFSGSVDLGNVFAQDFDAATLHWDRSALPSAVTFEREEFDVRLDPIIRVHRFTVDQYHLGDVALNVAVDPAPSIGIRAFAVSDLPDWNKNGQAVRPTNELDTEDIPATGQKRGVPPAQVARDASADSTSTASDDSFRKDKLQAVAFTPSTGNGGYVDIAEIRRVTLPKPVAASHIRNIQIARTDERPTSAQFTRTSQVATDVAFASLTWQLQVDGSRGVSLAFEMAEESPPARVIQPAGIRGTVPGPQYDSARSAASSEDSADPDTPIIPPKAKTVSFDFGNDAENVRDERRHYLALSPLIVFVVGSLLVTEGWQKLQPREEKHKPH